MERLSACSRFVVGSVQRADSARVLATLQNVGLSCELRGEYGADYLRKLLSAPAAWTSANERGEVVFLPSFSPEFVLRFWREGGGVHLHLATLNLLIYHRHFGGAARWLTSASVDAGPMEVAHEEFADAPSAFAGVFAETLPPNAAENRRAVIFDGMPLEVRIETAGKRADRSFHAPLQSEPEAHAWLNRLLEAASCFTSAETRKRLHEVRRYLSD